MLKQGKHGERMKITIRTLMNILKTNRERY